jgi:putative salt-induced outer membrane protein
MTTQMLTITTLTLLSLTPATAWAQDPAGTGTGVEQATSGSTELDGQGSFQTAEQQGDSGEESMDATELNVAAGGILSSGNANQAAATGAINFRIRRENHQFSSAALGNYGAAKIEDNSPYEPTVTNVQGRVRYDYFFARRWSSFGMVTARHDPFQQLDLRLNVDPGVAFYILPESNHRLWAEAGYDFQFDLRTLEGQAIKDDEGEFLDEDGAIVTDLADAAIDSNEKTATNHAARLFLGYSNHLTDSLHFDTGIEYLQSVLQAEAMRINFDAGLTATMSQKFSLTTTFTLRYDNNPIAGVGRLDTVSAINLAYRFL